MRAVRFARMDRTAAGIGGTKGNGGNQAQPARTQAEAAVKDREQPGYCKKERAEIIRLMKSSGELENVQLLEMIRSIDKLAGMESA